VNKEENSMSDPVSSSVRRRGLHLVRLQRLTDVLYAIIIWRVFMLIPKPDSVGKQWESLGAYLDENGAIVIVLLLALAWAVIYWLQSNQLLGVLQATDGVHSAFVLLQNFFLLVFLYSMKLGVEIGGQAGTWGFESISAALVGLCALLAFARARKKGLLHSDVTEEEARQKSIRYRAEPLTAAITIPFAFISGPVILGFSVSWEFSWFIYPIMVAVMNRIARRKKR
jgi:hypothetical protein